jgi:hypothetical protein
VKRVCAVALLLAACSREKRFETIPLDVGQPPPTVGAPPVPAPVEGGAGGVLKKERDVCYLPLSPDQFRVLSDTLNADGFVVVEGERYRCLGRNRFEEAAAPASPLPRFLPVNPPAPKRAPALSGQSRAPAPARHCYDARTEQEVREYLPAARAGIEFEVGGARYSCVNGPGKHVL